MQVPARASRRISAHARRRAAPRRPCRAGGRGGHGRDAERRADNGSGRRCELPREARGGFRQGRAGGCGQAGVAIGYARRGGRRGSRRSSPWSRSAPGISSAAATVRRSALSRRGLGRAPVGDLKIAGAAPGGESGMLRHGPALRGEVGWPGVGTARGIRRWSLGRACRGGGGGHGPPLTRATLDRALTARSRATSRRA